MKEKHFVMVNIMNHMSRLNKFTFNIRSSSGFYNEINLPSNENIQRTFREFQDLLCYLSSNKKKRIVMLIHIHIN
jgi:hypothetical protein